MISSSKCPKCDSSTFESVIETPKNSNFKLNFIRCASCKTVVGVLDFYNIGALIRSFANKLNINLD